MGVAKKPNSLMVVLALALALSSASAGKSPSPSDSLVVEFDNMYKNRVNLECGEGVSRTDVELDPGQSYSFKVDLRNKVEDAYVFSVDDDSVYVDGHGYDAIRDKGHMNIYWMVNKVGLYRGYDKTHWILEQKWSTIID